jgi:hypothetical protein
MRAANRCGSLALAAKYSAGRLPHVQAQISAVRATARSRGLPPLPGNCDSLGCSRQDTPITIGSHFGSRGTALRREWLPSGTGRSRRQLAQSPFVILVHRYSSTSFGGEDSGRPRASGRSATDSARRLARPSKGGGGKPQQWHVSGTAAPPPECEPDGIVPRHEYLWSGREHHFGCRRVTEDDIDFSTFQAPPCRGCLP